MSYEISALLQNGTWELDPHSTSQNVVGCKFVYRIKKNLDGSISKYKTRLVAKGFHQQHGINFHDTFSAVMKPTPIRLILSLALSHGWLFRQLDVNKLFYMVPYHKMCLRSNQVSLITPNFVCKLRSESRSQTSSCKLLKAIYGLKQVPRA